MSGHSFDDEFAQTVLTLGPGLRRTAYVIVRDWHTAEDMVQQAMAKMYVAWPRVREETRVAYARKVVVNECLSQLRRPRREILRSDLIDLEQSPTEYAGGPTPTVESIQLGRDRRGPGAAPSLATARSVFANPSTRPDQDELDIVTILGLLAPRQRAIVALRYVDDLSVDEVAAALGISAGTVKSQTARALATLRTHLSTHRSDKDPT